MTVIITTVCRARLVTMPRGQRVRAAVAAAVVFVSVLAFRAPANASPGAARWTSELPGVEPAATGRVVALTFDDGPDPSAIPQVLAILRRYGVPATFFMTGSGAAANPALVEAIARDDHVVAGHGWTHVPMTGLSDTELNASIRRTDDVLLDLTGRVPACVRPPYGAVSDRVVVDLERSGKRAALWSVDPTDWSGPGTSVIVSRVLDAVRPGAVILLHPGSGVRAQTVAALPSIIEGLAARGYSFVSVCGTGSAVRSVVSGEAFGPSTPPWPGSPATSKDAAVGAAQSPTGRGAWAVAGDGGVFSFGDAPFLGSTGGTRLNRPVVAMAATPSGHGYWLLASDGGVFAYGDAPFLGSTGGMRLNRPVVAMAATPSGHGYWLVASDGGVFAYGDAPFLGSPGGTRLNRPVVAMAATPSGHGYWLVASDGGVFAYGDALFAGSAATSPLASPVAAVARTASGRGYWMATRSGLVLSFGDAASLGSGPSTESWDTTVGLLPAGSGYWIVHSHPAVRPL